MCTDGTVTEDTVKRILDSMAHNWSSNALRNAKREAKRNHEQLRSYEIPFLTFNIANIQHMTKQ